MTQEEAIEVVKKNWPDSSYTCLREALTTLIPELKEGEDERIRKDIINLIYWLKGNPSLCSQYYNDRYDGMLDWLEKQKEQKPILEVFGFKVGDTVRLIDGDGRPHIIKCFEKIECLHGPDFYHVVFEDNTASDHIIPGDEYPNGYFTCMEKIDEREEKKPADLSEMMAHKEPYIAPVPTPMVADERKPISQEEWNDGKNILEDIIVFVSGYADKRVVTKWVSFLKSLYPQIKVEWSEEDETAFGDLMWCIKQAAKSAKDENDMGNVWFAEHWVKGRLKSLRPQPEQEWGEEDKKLLDFWLDVIDRNDWRMDENFCKASREFINRIKSLRPSWKPSKEQMRTLDIVISDYRHACTKGSDKKAEILKPLLEQLKKL